MKRCLLISLALLLTLPVSAQRRIPPLEPVPFDRVEVHDRLWGPWREQIATVTLPHSLEKTEPAIENLRRTANFLAGVPDEMPFVSLFVVSDLYKVMEAAAYSLAVTPDPALEAQMDSIIHWITGAQQPDGYMYESHVCGIPNVRDMGARPYENLILSHELYNMGHLYEAAIAYEQATGKNSLMQVAEKHARHVNRAFFEGDPGYNDGEPINHITGHPEIELALVKMYRHTGDPLYRRMADRFIAIRGTDLRDTTGFDLYRSQEHMPLKDMREPEGHAVCATYIYTGMDMVDEACHSNIYGEALESIWDEMVATRISITGSLGSVHGIEGFGDPYDLPNKRTYNETCAAVGNVLMNDELFRNRRDAKYIDIMEVSLYNGAMSGINLRGDRFFYTNPLEADGLLPFNIGAKGRTSWHNCACCPPNITRLLMKAPGYMYYHFGNDLYFTLYGTSSTEVELEHGTVAIEQQSDYPFSGTSQIVLTPDKPQRFTVRLRIPTWARSYAFLPGDLYTYAYPTNASWLVTVNDKPVEAHVENGFAVIDRRWRAGDRIELTLPWEPRYVEARPEVEADRDRLAVTLGPLVYCAEEADNGLVQEYYIAEADPATSWPFPNRTPTYRAKDADSGEVTDYYLAPSSPIKVSTVDEGLLEGLPALTIPARKLDEAGEKTLTLIPYYAWDNRGDASMIVWMPQKEEMARESLPATIRNRAWLKSLTLTSNDTKASHDALFDGVTPDRSHHRGHPLWTSRGCEGETQQAELIFTGPQRLSSLSVFWVNDGRGTTLLPQSWSLEYLRDGVWHPFRHYLTDFYSLNLDIFNEIRPENGELRCDGIRMTLIPQPGQSVGMAELRLDFAQ